VTGTVTAASAISLTVAIDPTSQLVAGNLDAQVTATGGTSSSQQVATVVPVITSATNNLAAHTGTIVISGFGFDPTSGNDAVTFNDGAMGNVSAATATSITVNFTTKPTTSGTLTAVVTTDSATSGLPIQVGTVTPVITSSTAGLAANATSLTIAGFGFD